MGKKDAAVDTFVEMYRRVKTEQKGTRPSLLGLSDGDTKNFKAICQRGYTLIQIEEALVAMFTGPDKWAVEFKKDTATHFLRQFDQYRNIADEMAVTKPGKASRREVTQEEKDAALKERERIDWLNECKKEYSKSLRDGDWSGGIGMSIPIGQMFADCFTQKEKSELFRLAKDIAADNRERIGEPETMREVSIRALMTDANMFCEVVVKEAVKRKIKEPWSQG